MLTDITTRRLSIGELFKYSAELYRKNLKWIAIISLGVFLPYHIVMLFAPSLDMNTVYQAMVMQDADSMRHVFITSYVTLSISLVFTPLAVAGVTALAKNAIENKPVSIGEILDASLVKWGKLVLTAFLYMFCVAIGCFIIIPGIYISVTYTFYPNIIAFSDKWGLSALHESAELVKGRWFATFGFTVLIAVLTFIITILCAVIFVLVLGDGGLINVLADVVIQTLCLYFHIIIALWCLNQHYIKNGSNYEES